MSELSRSSQTIKSITKQTPVKQVGKRLLTLLLVLLLVGIGGVTAVYAAPPVIQPDQSFTVLENSATGTGVGTVATTGGPVTAFSLLAGNTGDAFSINPTTGQITVLTGTAVDFETTPVFTLVISAANADGAAQEEVTINVVDVNDPPAFDQSSYSFNFAENNAVGEAVGAVLATDPDGNTITYSIMQWITAAGPFSLNPNNGNLTATASLNYETDQRTYIFIAQASDGGRSSTALVTLNLQNANDAPVANDDTDVNYTTAENTPLLVATPTVLDNDTDEDGDDLTAVLEIQPANGSVTLNSDGTFTYIPDTNYNGLDTFTYQADDGQDLSNIATVTITVTGVNDPPTAVDDSYTTPEETTLTVDAPGILDNDTDPENDVLTAVLIDDVLEGALDWSSDGSFVYTPTVDFFGVVTFTYQAQDDGDGNLLSNTATVTITVTNVNDAPEVDDETWSLDENAAADTLVGALTVTDPDGDTAFTYDITAGNTNNAFLLNSTGQLRVNSSSALDFETTPVFTLTVAATDSGFLTGEAEVIVNLNDINEAPTAVPDPNYTTAEDTPLVVNIPGVLGNDTDPDGDSLLAYLNNGASSGAVTLNPDGSFIYTPTLNFNGVVTFTYFVIDSGSPQLSSNTATVTITVTPVNDAPVAVDDPETSGDYDTPEDTQLTISAANGVLDNDSDVDGDGLTAVLDTNVSSGSLTLNPNGSFNFTPVLNFTGAVTFTYHALDDGAPPLPSNTATVTITVTPVNDAPVINDQSFSIDENSAVSTPVGTVTALDVDNAPADLAFDILPGGSGDGSFGIDASSGEISVINNSALDMETTQSFTLTVVVSDTEPLSETAVITINLNNVNEFDPEIAAGQEFTITESAANNTTVGAVDAADADYGESVAAFAITGGNTAGIFAIDNSGLLRVADNTNLDFETTDAYTLDIEVTDNGFNPGARIGTGQVVVHITDANDAPIIASLTADPVNTTEGSAITLDGVFTDEDVADTHSVTINWGDGSANTVLNPAVGVYTFTTSHTYADDPAGLPDVYTIQVTVSDGSANDVDAATVTVANVAPTLSNVAIAPTTTDEGSSATLSGDISDPGVQDAFTLVVTWGDGQSRTYNYPAGTTTFSENHTLADDGQPLTVALTLTDDDGGQDTGSVTITVNNLPPAADAGPDQTVNAGETVNFDASGTTDPGSADTHTFAWDFDDGAVGTGVTPSHVYASIGVYTATLTVTDDDGGEDTDEVVITVVSPSDLAATKTVSGDFAEGGTIFYTIAITNSSSTQLDNAGDELVDVLPAQLALVEAQVVSGGGAVNANLPANTVTWNGSIASGGSVVLSIEAAILAGHKGEQVSNQATLHYDADGNGSNEAITYTDDPAVDGSDDPTVFTIQNEYFVFMPVILNNFVSAPDLVVTDVQASSSFIQVVIQNQGNAPALESFWVDFYINPNPAPTMANELWPEVAAEGLAWGFTDMLAPGEVLTLTYSTAPGAANDYFVAEESLYSGSLPAGTPVYAQVDSAHAGIASGAVLELDELPGGVYNNIYGTMATAVSQFFAASASANGAGPVNLVNVLLLPSRR